MPSLSCAPLRSVTLLLGLGFTALWAAAAHAALGGDAASVSGDAAQLGATVSASSQPLYSVQEFTAATGVRVREYLGRDGVVFALSWSGPVVPDLQLLLGAHYGDYAAAQAAQQNPGLHRSGRLTLPGAVVETSGHLRAYSGRAYLPPRIPAGVALADLN